MNVSLRLPNTIVRYE